MRALLVTPLRDGIDAACRLAQSLGVRIRTPWLMMSINDDEEDPHFRKAIFDPDLCPAGEYPHQHPHPHQRNPCPRSCPAALGRALRAEANWLVVEAAARLS